MIIDDINTINLKEFDPAIGTYYMIAGNDDQPIPVGEEPKILYAQVALHKPRVKGNKQYNFNHSMWATVFSTYNEAHETQLLYDIPGNIVQIGTFMKPAYHIFKTHCDVSVKKIWLEDVERLNEGKLYNYYFNIETQLDEFKLKLAELKIDALDDIYKCINHIMSLKYD